MAATSGMPGADPGPVEPRRRLEPKRVRRQLQAFDSRWQRRREKGRRGSGGVGGGREQKTLATELSAGEDRSELFLGGPFRRVPVDQRTLP
jgi:hypothetical protein